MADPNDGVLQLIANPDNPNRAIMAVTGQSEEALTKAALALAGSTTLGVMGGPVALIAESRATNDAAVGPTLSTIMTFEDLGYQESDLTVSGRGNRVIEIGFDVPLNTQVTEDAYVNLIFSYARRLKGARTTLSLLMNGTPFASQMLDADTSDGSQPTTVDAGGQSVLKAMIPPSMVTPGERNVLTVNVDVEGDWNCFPPGQYGVFFTASPSSTLSLPVQTAETAITPRVSRFPFPFDVTPDLHDLLVTLPAKPTNQELEAAMSLIARLGSVTSDGKAFSPQIALGELPSGIDLASFNIIVLGRPTTNPFLEKLNDSLPQPFAPGTDDLQQVLDNVSVRLLPGHDLGVLQMLRSPWGNNHMILVVSGNGQKGQDSAIDTLLNAQPGRDNLRGDIVYITANAVVPFDTQGHSKRYMLTAVPSAVAAQESATPEPVVTNEPGVPPPTVTKIPTSTATLVVTAGPSPTPTSLYTLTPTPITPTPIPTFPPLTDVAPPRIDPPAWLNTLIGATFVVVVTSILFGLMMVVRRGRSRA